MAISDPYLAYAIPIKDDGLPRKNHSLLVPKGYVNTILGEQETKRLPRMIWEGLPQTSTEFLEQVGYNDVGALVLALPLKMREPSLPTAGVDSNSSSDDSKIKAIRESIKCIVKNFMHDNDENQSRRRGSFDLQCMVEDHLTLSEARKMAMEEQEMWEEVSLDCDTISPETHAACALNAFLWRHTGGWRNTFG